MKLKTYFWVYNLELIKEQYQNNWRTYYWLFDKENWEPFSDITVNDPCEMLDSNEHLIDHDFLCCFGWNVEAMRKRLEKNLKITDFRNWGQYYHFTI